MVPSTSLVAVGMHVKISCSYAGSGEMETEDISGGLFSISTALAPIAVAPKESVAVAVHDKVSKG